MSRPLPGRAVDDARIEAHTTSMSSERADTERSAQEVAESAARTWQGLAARLTPIIGELGFRALYARSLHITQQDFPWMRCAQPGGDAFGLLFSRLKDGLQDRHPALAEDAHHTLLNTFTTLLSSLIGETLTARLVHESRDGASAARPQESSNDR
jgi:hypothetical protein